MSQPDISNVAIVDVKGEVLSSSLEEVGLGWSSRLPPALTGGLLEDFSTLT